MNKALIGSGIIIASLALAGNAAMAATTHHAVAKAAHVARARPAVHVAARRVRPRTRLDGDIAQFIQSMLGGGPVQYSNLIRDVERMPASRRSSGPSYSPSYDTSSSTVDAGSAARDAQAASDAENQAIQQMNDTNAMTASMAAAEQQNDAAVAATQQTEINAGM